MTGLVAIPWSRLTERRIPREKVAEWSRIRDEWDYAELERERAAARRIGVSPVAPRLSRRMHELARALEIKQEQTINRCACGCGQRTKDYNVYVEGHRVYGREKLTPEQVEEQIARIPNTELGRLAKKCLLADLARAGRAYSRRKRTA